jgi:hypothetical protein
MDQAIEKLIEEYHAASVAADNADKEWRDEQFKQERIIETLRKNSLDARTNRQKAENAMMEAIRNIGKTEPVVIKTGVFATTQEVDKATDLAIQARNAPLAKVNGVWLCEEADEVMHAFIDEAAIGHGLPPPNKTSEGVNHYGLLKTGEFTRTDVK